MDTNENQIIENTILFVKETLKNAEGGHDWFHIERVHRTSLVIAKTEEVNPFIVALGALLHDIADAKFYDGDETVGPKMATDFLKTQHVSNLVIDEIIYIINTISFKNYIGKSNSTSITKELQVIQDADRLDAIGAIGIARAFNYGGFKNRVLYNPEIKPQLNQTKEEYKKSESPTINHFYEKLLLLKDMMNTKTGKSMAQERHKYMENFLKQFYKEWGV